MRGIKGIGAYLPVTKLDNLARLSALDMTEPFLRDKVGFESVRRRSPGEDTSDLCVGAFRDLQERHGVKQGEVSCILVCTQNPDGTGLPHTSAIVHAKLGLPDTVAAFD